MASIFASNESHKSKHSPTKARCSSTKASATRRDRILRICSQRRTVQLNRLFDDDRFGADAFQFGLQATLSYDDRGIIRQTRQATCGGGLVETF